MRIWLGVGITVLIIIIVVPAGKILTHISPSVSSL